MNEHATKVLDAYLDAENLSVPHAILIEGRWGSGKTYFLQNIYEPDRRQRMYAERRHHIPFLFVSLFGATSANDVEMRIYKTACPGEAVAGGIAGTITLGIGEFFRLKDTTRGVVDKLGKKAIKRLNDFVFVFDDLERVEKQAFGEVMGLVNSLVTDHGRRVLLVTDEDKLEKLIGDEIWKDQNEKIVGRRAHIEPDFENVIRVSIRGLANGPSKVFLSEKIEVLLGIARISGVENLRSLSWAMHNAATFVDSLIADNEIPESHVVRTMGLVLATTLWLRSGLLDTETLEKIPGLSMALAVRSMGARDQKTQPDPQFEKAKNFSEVFATLSVDSPPIDYGFIKAFESSGVLDRSEVNLWIKSQFGFGKKYKEPAWRRLWYSHERPKSETEEAIAELTTELCERVYTKSGPILHAAGLAVRQWIVNDRRLTRDEALVTFFKRYIDELAEKRLLEGARLNGNSMSFDSYAGLGFSSRETTEFQEIFQYLCDRSQQAFISDLEERAESILSEAEDGNLEALFKLVHTDDYELLANPVLYAASLSLTL